MSGSGGYLVIGGDSLVGGSLVRALRARGHRVIASTRRRETLGDDRVLLDFEDESTFRMPQGCDYAFVVAAATNYERCEKDPLAYRINCELTPRCVAALLAQGAFVTFISTNSVFGGEQPWPEEQAPHAPGIAYAKQKAEGEQRIRAEARRLRAEERLGIVRLTKILNAETPPLPRWFAAWARGQTIEPFADLIFAPLSVRFAGNALAQLGEKRVAGDLHLSGAENVSYVDFAVKLARRLGVDSRLIAPTTAEAKGVHIAFKPRYSGLGMRRTTELTGVSPQPIDDVVDELAAEHNERRAT
jgi:dTDP-4-dehydrorhamnose reductase